MLDALRDFCGGWQGLQPPHRLRVSEGAQSLILRRPGGSGGPWSPTETPYMVEPTDALAGGRGQTAVCFVGPAQTGKTAALGLGWLTHAALHDPGDMLIVQMTQEKAREYKRKEMDRAFRNSPALKAMLTSRSADNNMHDVALRNGMMVRIAWPTITNFSSTPYRYVFGTDYDRWADDIDGEGDGFTLMGKRTTTFMSRGMVAVESSPGRAVTVPAWQPASPHEAPPVGGILGVYNRSDRRRWYWACPHCSARFEAAPGIGLFRLPETETLLEDIRTLDIDAFARQHSSITCPEGCVISFGRREAMNAAGVWVPDEGRTSTIAGFWLGGVAAAYTSWETLVRKHMQALLEYALTGSELLLQTTANTDQGVPHMSQHLVEASRTAARGDATDTGLQRYIVPPWTRFLAAAVDVQGGKSARFVVQVHAVGENNEQALVDRYSITESARDGMDGRPAPLDPASYGEDWDTLTDKVLRATYRTPHPDREMKVRVMAFDTGGEDGVTDKAYAYYRRLRKIGLHHHVRPMKGAATRVDWHLRESMVGGTQGTGDVPLVLYDPNKIKDTVAAGLARRTPGPGYYHWPTWLPPAFFDELRAEVRNANGVWEQIKKRNESLDLCVMIRAALLHLGCDKREFWNSPPSWAHLWDTPTHPDVITREERRVEHAAAPSAPPVRRTQRSAYLG